MIKQIFEDLFVGSVILLLVIGAGLGVLWLVANYPAVVSILLALGIIYSIGASIRAFSE